MTAKIDRDVWLTAMQEANAPPVNDPSALTTKEFAKEFNLGRAAASRRLAVLVETGKVDVTTKWVPRGTVGYYKVPAYRIKKAPKK